MTKSIKIRRVKGEELNETNIHEYLPRGAEDLEKVKSIVQEIIDTVKVNGDSAVKEYTEKFDGIDYSILPLQVSEEEIEEAFGIIDEKIIEAIKKAKENIEKFHTAQLKKEWYIETKPGVKTGQIMRSISDVGLYIPGGLAVYPSSVLMTAVPAKVAGSSRLVVCSPPQKNGKVSPAIIVAAKLCGVDEIFRCGGAQAVAAMAYGTESIKPVFKIVGPGNKWVNAAKQLVSTKCGIDNPAGPSEVLVISDGSSPAVWSAFDLLAQCEHGPDNVSVLLSESDEVISEIVSELEKITEESTRKDYVFENLEKYGLIITTNSHKETIRVMNLVATEHLQLNVKNPREWLPEVQNAGAVFLGVYSPVPMGDYCAGTNHVLPTAGYARMYSGLSSFDFVKVMDVLECTRDGLESLYPILESIAGFEGLTGHYNCVKERLKKE